MKADILCSCEGRYEGCLGMWLLKRRHTLRRKERHLHGSSTFGDEHQRGSCVYIRLLLEMPGVHLVAARSLLRIPAIKSVRGNECDEEFEPGTFLPIIEGTLHLDLKLPPYLGTVFPSFFPVLLFIFNSDVSKRRGVFSASLARLAQFRLERSP
jgi:hypothetical protein